MKIPSPQEMDGYDIRNSATHRCRVSDIIDHFLVAVKTKDFHAFSDQRTNMVMFSTRADYSREAAFNDAVKQLNEVGWCVHYRKQTSAQGWFHAIIWEP